MLTTVEALVDLGADHLVVADQGGRVDPDLVGSQASVVGVASFRAR
jgi:hypothetical protein